MARGGFGLSPGGRRRRLRLLLPSSATSKARALLAGPARPRLGGPGGRAPRAASSARRRARPARSPSAPRPRGARLLGPAPGAGPAPRPPRAASAPPPSRPQPLAEPEPRPLLVLASVGLLRRRRQSAGAQGLRNWPAAACFGAKVSPSRKRAPGARRVGSGWVA